MSIFKRRRDLGPLLLGIWLVATGIRHLINLNFAFADQIFALLALAAGVAVLLGR